MSPLNGKLGGTLQIASALGPVLMLALVGYLFLNGYLQNQETKDRQSLAVAREVVGIHESAPGHPVVLERVDDLSEDLDLCREEVKDELKALQTKVDAVLASIHEIQISLARTGG